MIKVCLYKWGAHNQLITLFSGMLLAPPIYNGGFNTTSPAAIVASPSTGTGKGTTTGAVATGPRLQLLSREEDQVRSEAAALCAL